MSNLMSHNPLITETTLKQKTLNYKQMKIEEQNSNELRKLQLNIHSVSSSC